MNQQTEYIKVKLAYNSRRKMKELARYLRENKYKFLLSAPFNPGDRTHQLDLVRELAKIEGLKDTGAKRILKRNLMDRA